LADSELAAVKAELETALAVDPAAPGSGPEMDSVRFWQKRINDLKARIPDLTAKTQQRLAALQEAQQSVESAIASETQQVQRLRQTFSEADATRDKFISQANRLNKKIDFLWQQVRGAGDVTEQSIAAAKQQATAAEQALANAKRSIDPYDARQMANAQAKLSAAEAQAREAEDALRQKQTVAGAASRSGVIPADGRVSPGAVRTALSGGFEIASVLLMGGASTYGQSNEEIDTILRNGQEWINLMKVRQKAVDREIDEQTQRAETLRHALAVCIEGQKANMTKTGAPTAMAGMS
jgi:hypothetical protein